MIKFRQPIMDNNQSKNYNNIASPYDDYLNRSVSSDANAIEYTMPAGDADAVSGESYQSPSGKPSILSSSLTDAFIETFIKSRNYQPKTSGFCLDGRIGYIEAMDLYIKGSIVGGSLNIPDTTSGWHVDISGNMWWGTSATYAGATIKISEAGSINFTTGTFSGNVTGSTITGGTITGSIFSTAASPNQRIVLSAANQLFYDENNIQRLILIGNNSPIKFLNNGTETGQFNVETSILNPDGVVEIQTTNDFTLRAGHSSNQSVTNFEAAFQDSRISTHRNFWARFKVRDVSVANDYDLSFFAKTLIDPNAVIIGTCDTPSANHLIKLGGVDFAASDVGKIAWNRVQDTFATIITFNSISDLTLSADIFDIEGENYEIFNEPTAVVDIVSDIIRLRTSKTPASAAATGNQGDICWDANYIYVCTATDTWKRVDIATW